MSAGQSENPYATTTSAPPSYGSRVDDRSTAYGAPTRTGRNGMGVAALVLGILAVLTCWIIYVSIPLGVLAIVFGVIGRGRARRGEATNAGSAMAGMVLGIIGVVLSIALVAAGVAFLHSKTGHCIQNNQGNQAAQQQCLK